MLLIGMVMLNLDMKNILKPGNVSFSNFLFLIFNFSDWFCALKKSTEKHFSFNVIDKQIEAFLCLIQFVENTFDEFYTLSVQTL